MAESTSKTDAAPKGSPETVNPETGELVSAWELDERFGVRLDQTFTVGERFMLLASKSEGTIPTDIGEAEVVSLLVQRLDDQGVPTGIPFKVNTLARAIVDKMANASDGDFPAIVELGKVRSKRFNRDALVITKVGGESPDQLYAEFGVSAATRDRASQIQAERSGIPY